jgi:hypothetical protein
MRSLLAAAILAVSIGASAAPIPPSTCPNCLLNTPTPQVAQANVGTWTVRGTITASTGTFGWLQASWLDITGITGSGAGLTALNASALASARLAGPYTGITGVGALTAGEWRADPVGTQYGGTGRNWVAVSSGSIPYFSSVGTMSALSPGASNYLLQANGVGSAPSWTATPRVLGTNITGLPLTALSAGTLPSAVQVADASLSVVSGSKVTGNITGSAANITGDLALAQLSTGTLPTTIPASSITVTGAAPGTYPATPSRIPILVVRTDGRLSSVTQQDITLPLSQLNNGTLPAGVKIAASSINDGLLPTGVTAQAIIDSGVTAGTYGDTTHSAQVVIAKDGRITYARQFSIPGVSSDTAMKHLNNYWPVPQTSSAAWVFLAPVTAASFSTTGTITGTILPSGVDLSTVTAALYAVGAATKSLSDDLALEISNRHLAEYAIGASTLSLSNRAGALESLTYTLGTSSAAEAQARIQADYATGGSTKALDGRATALESLTSTMGESTATIAGIQYTMGQSTASTYAALESTAGALTAEIARAVAAENLKLTSGAIPSNFVDLSTVTTALDAHTSALATKLSSPTATCGSGWVLTTDGAGEWTCQPAPSAAGLTYVMTVAASDVSGALQMVSAANYTPAARSTTTSATNPVVGTYIATRTTNVGFPGQNYIPAGTYHVHFHAKASNANRFKLRPEIYIYHGPGDEPEWLEFTEETPFIPTSETQYDLYFLGPSTTILTTDRITYKLKFTASGNGTVEIYAGGIGSDGVTGGQTNARLEMPSVAASVANFISVSGNPPHAGGISLGNNTLTSAYGVNAATMVVTGNSFSVGTSTLVVSNGLVGIGQAASGVYGLDINPLLKARSRYYVGNLTAYFQAESQDYAGCLGDANAYACTIKWQNGRAAVGAIAGNDAADACSTCTFHVQSSAGHGLSVTGNAQVDGNSFSVGGSTLVVANGMLGLGTTPSYPLHILKVQDNTVSEMEMLRLFRDGGAAAGTDRKNCQTFYDGNNDNFTSAICSIRHAAGGDHVGQLAFHANDGASALPTIANLPEVVRITSLGLFAGVPQATFIAGTEPNARLSVMQAVGDSYAVKVTSNNGTTPMLAIQANGNVGIGTASPGSALDVNGASTLRGASTVDGSSLTVNGNFKVTGSDGLNVYQTAGVGGNVLLANSTPLIDWAGSSAITMLNNAYWQSLDIKTNGGSRLRIGADNIAAYSPMTISGSSLTVNGAMLFQSKTKANFDALDPVIAGEYYFCSDCTIPGLCVSSGTAVAQWRRDYSATVGCGSGE